MQAVIGMAINVRCRSVPRASQRAAKAGVRVTEAGRKSCGKAGRYGRWRRPAQQIMRSTLIGSLAWLSLFSTSTAAPQAPAKPVVHDLQEMAKTLDACVRPLAVRDRYQGILVAARLGFNARGQPLGPPRFTYVTPKTPDPVKNEYKKAILDALTKCMPVPFSRQLGATIAGVPFVLSFNECGLARVWLAGSSASVMPLPLSRIPRAITPAGHGPPMWAPVLASAMPRLPHDRSTSQDRQGRCTDQTGLGQGSKQ